MSIVRGRLAPSPTGALHLGNAFTFLIAWLLLRRNSGTMVLRIEDLEGHGRDPEETIQSNCRDLLRLGLDWDEGPFRQSERLPFYREALEKLHALGLVYPCVCSRRDFTAAPHAEDYRVYPGNCSGRFTSYAEAEHHLEHKRNPVWRFRVPDREIIFHDGIRGEQRVNPARTFGDFPLARHPWGAGYQLAVVLDDIAMNVTQVVRGEDLLGSTPWQILLYEALAPEYPLPAFHHVPVVVDADGNRLAKRKGDLTLDSLFKRGVPPERILGLLGFWAGWAKLGEELSLKELLDRFDPATIAQAHPKLDASCLQLLISGKSGIAGARESASPLP